MKLSVILIAHNEENSIGEMVENLLKHYDNEIFELVVVDDASYDKTPLIIEKWTGRDQRVKLVKRFPPSGVGRALQDGFKVLGQHDGYILMMDADFTKNINEVRYLIKEIEKHGYDGVVGSRFIKGSRLINYPIGKYIANRLYASIVRMLFKIQQHDLTNNFRIYKASQIRDIKCRSKGYAINAEIGILPLVLGYTITEVPVSWIGRNAHMGKSKFSILKEAWGYILVIIYAVLVVTLRGRARLLLRKSPTNILIIIYSSFLIPN